MRPKEATSDSVIRPFLACQSLVVFTCFHKQTLFWMIQYLAESCYLGLALDFPNLCEDASFMSSNY